MFYIFVCLPLIERKLQEAMFVLFIVVSLMLASHIVGSHTFLCGKNEATTMTITGRNCL